MTSTYHFGLLILRVVVSGLMLTHGIPKLMDLVQGNMDFGDPIGIGNNLSFVLAVIAEAICPLLIIIGFKTRLAAIPPVIAMGVAVLVVHAADSLGTKELALIYLFAFLAIALTGAGKYSVDRK